MIRKSALETVGGYDPSIAIEDWYMWLKLSKLFPFYFVDDYLGFYRMHEGNMSKKLEWMVGEKEKILSQWCDDPIYPLALSTHNIMSFWKLSSANKQLSIKYLKKSCFKKNILSKYFYKGLVKLFLPNRDYALR